MRAKNKKLIAAKKSKKNEFYTQLADIEKELLHYKQHFKGKTVLCNCDDPLESNFVRYFSLNFERLGLKKLIATHYKESNLFTKEPPYKLEYTGDKNGNKVPDPEEFITELLDDGDFCSPECEDLLEEADIVVTNPPFTLFREYLDHLMLFEKKFLIIGNINAITYKVAFELIKANEIWVGHNFNKTLSFVIPDEYEKYDHIDADGNKIARVPGICWFTNLKVTKRSEFITLYKKYSPKEYPKYDNYDAIEVSRVTDIPMNYEGEMGVPITFLGRYNPKQFEISGLMNDKREKCDAFIQGKPVHLDEKHKKFVGAVLNGKAPYARIIIRNRKPEK